MAFFMCVCVFCFVVGWVSSNIKVGTIPHISKWTWTLKFRNAQTQMRPEEIAEEIEVNPGEIKVRTPSGFANVTRAYKTKPLCVWKLSTDTRTILAAGSHILKTETGICAWLQDIQEGEYVETEDGPQKVTSVHRTQYIEEMYDFQVDTKDHLYFTDGFVSHNSVGIAARQLIFTKLIPGYKSLYITPLAHQLKTYSNKLEEMQEAFSQYTPQSRYQNNLYYKEIPVISNGQTYVSSIRLMDILTNASKARGGTYSEICLDEFQDFDPDLLPEIEETVDADPFSYMIFSGTSLTTLTALEAYYAVSSRGTWVIKCPGCNFENWGDLDCEYYAKSGRRDVFDLIRPDGLHCIKCNGKLRPEDGRYLHRDMGALEENRVGLHFPQVMVPGFYYDETRYAKLVTKKAMADRNKFLQEKLGIPVEEGEREISERQLAEICTLGNDLQVLKDTALSGGYAYVCSGVDWGGSDANKVLKTKTSFTVHSILGMTNNGHIDILHMRRYSGMTYFEIAGNIMRDHYSYGASAIATDAGVGQLYNKALQENLQNPHQLFIIAYGGMDTGFFAPCRSKQQEYNKWILNRTESISKLFEFVRNGRLRCYCWEQAADMLRDIMNLYRHPLVNDNTGVTKLAYRRIATKPDDTLHSLNFGMTILRSMAGEPMFTNLDDRTYMQNYTDILNPSRGPSARERIDYESLSASLPGWG